MLRAACLFPVFLLTACGTPERGAAAPEPGAVLRIGPSGTMGLTAATPFTLPALERAFPGFEVVAVQQAGQPAFNITEPGDIAPVFVVTPDWTRGYAGAVATADRRVEGPGGMRAGVTRHSQLPEDWQSDCGGAPLTCEQLEGGTGLRLEFASGEADPVLAQMIYLPPVP